MRWPIESCFAEGKEEVGLDHDELRFWPGWHHHMTLVLLAHHFLVRLQQRLDQRGGAWSAPRPDLLPQTTVYLGPASSRGAQDLASLLPPAPALRLSVAEVRLLL